MLTSSSRLLRHWGQVRRKTPVIIHRQSPAVPIFNPCLLSPALPRSKSYQCSVSLLCPQEVTNGLKTSPTRMKVHGKASGHSCQHSLAVTKHMFILLSAAWAEQDWWGQGLHRVRGLPASTLPKWGIGWWWSRPTPTVGCYGNLTSLHSASGTVNKMFCAWKQTTWVIFAPELCVNNLSTLPPIEAEIVGMSFDVHFSAQMASQQPYT